MTAPNLSSSEITLSTHVADIVSAIEYADLRDVVLVAHSYSGMPATIAANRMSDRISRVVYLAAVLALAGVEIIEFEADHWPMATKPAELAALLSRIATVDVGRHRPR